MKRILSGLIAVLLFSPVVNATGINVLSEEHHIKGEAGIYYEPRVGEPRVFLHYDILDDQPVSYSVSGEYLNPGDTQGNPCLSSASAGNFEINAEAWYDSRAEATSIYTFTTDYSRFTLSAYVAFESIVGGPRAEISLVDLTGSSAVEYSFEQKDFFAEDFYLTTTLYVNPSHEYQLTLYANSFDGLPFVEGGGTAETNLRCNLFAQPSPVPEPSTILLVALGFTGLLGKRKYSSSSHRQLQMS